MTAYILRRLLILFPTLLGVSVIIFFMLHITPGDPAELLLGERASEEALHDLREHLGLNRPLYVQYGMFLKRLATLDLGETIWTRQKVWIEIQQRFPATIELSVTALMISCTLGMILGIISATKQYSIFDYLSMLGALVGVSMPIFWLGLVFMLIFSVNLGWLPISGRLSVGVDLDVVTNFYILDAIIGANWEALEGRALAPDHAGLHALHHPDRHRGAHDALLHAGGAAPGLHQDRQGQGPVAVQGDLQARAAQRAHPGGHHHRPAVRRAAWAAPS